MDFETIEPFPIQTKEREVTPWIENNHEVGIIIKETMTAKEAEKRYGYHLIR